ncbi:GNAT family N-acetyltransferase [Glutamicibacter endophyticus]|uniref:GNAT family N-acetyltransferase n=1 Tax=Glutamicibacter endophyticus TaxID=1522174 RepID=UPI003AF0EC9B
MSEFKTRLRATIQDDQWLLGVIGTGPSLGGYLLAQDYGSTFRTTFSVGRIHGLYVRGTVRHQGLGRALVEYAIEWAYNRAHPMILDWQARPESISFYESMGFVADYVGGFPSYPGFSVDSRKPRTNRARRE